MNDHEQQANHGKHTPLYALHVECGGKMVPFAGYVLPVQYTGVIAEHMAVRNAAGMFDVSHMGEVRLFGRDAFSNLQNLLTNDFSGMADGRVRYSPMCNEEGGVVDDLIVYRYNEEDYLLVVNAANRAKDVAWMRRHLSGDAALDDISDDIAQIALQGPASKEILSRISSAEDIPEKYYSFRDGVRVGDAVCLLSQTGYTGELGYEIYMKNEDAPALWRLLLKTGQDLGLVPAGLGARDTLRLEAGMPLYGHEMSETITPLEADLGFAVKMDKADFIGKAALASRGKPQQKRVGLQMTGRGIARENESVFIGDSQVGRTTSGTHCPYLARAVAMASLDDAHTAPGTQVEVEVRGRRIAAEVVPLPFYKRAK